MNFKIGEWHKFSFDVNLCAYTDKNRNNIVRLNKKEIIFLLLEFRHDEVQDLFGIKILYEGMVYYFYFVTEYLKHLTCL